MVDRELLVLPDGPNVAASDIKALTTFANGIRGDLTVALRLSCNNGQTEGRVIRLRLINRQMYGWAKFDLLRQRVLAALHWFLFT